MQFSSYNKDIQNGLLSADILLKMANQTQCSMSNILDITPSTKTPWTVLIQALELGHTQENKNKEHLRRLLFTDEKGTKVSVVIYRHHLPLFQHTFKPYKRYYISNAVITKPQPPLISTPYKYSWSLNYNTTIQPHGELHVPALPCHFQFTPFVELYKYIGTNIYPNIEGIVVKCFPTEQLLEGSDPSSKTEVILVNEEKTLLMLTLYDTFDENEGSTLRKITKTSPTLFGMRLHVTTHNGLSVETTTNSGIMINAPTPSLLSLKYWYSKNKREISQLIEKKTYKHTNLLIPFPKTDDILPVTTAITKYNTSQPIWIKGKLSLLHEDINFYNTICANCLNIVDADETWIITCPFCDNTSEVLPILKAKVAIQDETGSLIAIMSTPHFENFTCLTPQTIKTAENNGQSLHSTIAASIDSLSTVTLVYPHKMSPTFKIITAHPIKNSTKRKTAF